MREKIWETKEQIGNIRRRQIGGLRERERVLVKEGYGHRFDGGQKPGDKSGRKRVQIPE